LSNLLGTREDADSAAISLKLYADLQLQAGHFKAAHSAYHRLANMELNGDMACEVTLYAALTDLLVGVPNDGTLVLFATSRRETRSIAHAVLCCLGEFAARLAIGRAPWLCLLPFAIRRTTPPLLAAVGPFLTDQLAAVSRPRHRLLYRVLAASGYLELELPEPRCRSCARRARRPRGRGSFRASARAFSSANAPMSSIASSPVRLSPSPGRCIPS
jgi:hypothetical protein